VRIIYIYLPSNIIFNQRAELNALFHHQTQLFQSLHICLPLLLLVGVITIVIDQPIPLLLEVPKGSAEPLLTITGIQPLSLTILILFLNKYQQRTQMDHVVALQVTRTTTTTITTTTSFRLLHILPYPLLTETGMPTVQATVKSLVHMICTAYHTRLASLIH
jgi:hypothetical protein